MGNLLAYSGIVTKVRAMEGKLLKPKQFEIIAGLGSVPEIVEYLKKIQRMPMCLTRWKRSRSTGEISRRFWCSRCIMIIQNSTGSADRSRDDL